ncbi:MAG: transporter, partial [Planctomycetes bacterium]|nr:transporter [Planctomycetota bacterium]
MQGLLRTLAGNPLLLLLAVAAVGYALGKATRLGLAAVLFTGLAFGALDPSLRLPEEAYLSGLALFVYALGLSYGPSFFASLRRRGMRDTGLVLGVLALVTLVTAAAARLLGVDGALAAGAFSGGLTNTPALAAVLESIQHAGGEGDLEKRLLEPVVAYSLTYPFGVGGMLLAMEAARRRFGLDPRKDAAGLAGVAPGADGLDARTVRVFKPRAVGRTLGELLRAHGWRVVFARHRRRDGLPAVALDGTMLEEGDQLTLVGPPAEVAAVMEFLGEENRDPLDLDRAVLDYRRIFVSSREAAGFALGDLHLPERFGVVVTRVRRGDAEFVPAPDTTLELGDRVRVVGRVADLERAGRFLGDSYRAVSEIDLLSFSVGLTLGIVLGMVAVELPGGVKFRLGLAGGPLVVALVLGSLGRTGPLLWTLPYSANLTLRQFGMVLFLAGVGTRAGGAFVGTLAGGGGWALLGLGAVITATAAAARFAAGRLGLGSPMTLPVGMAGGMQTQPAL